MAGKATDTLSVMTDFEHLQNKAQDKRFSGIYTALLFALIAIFLMIALLFSASIYQKVNSMRVEADDARAGLSVISNAIRMNDVAGGITEAEGPEGPALVLTEYAGHATYEIRIYSVNGQIVEEYSRNDTPIDPSRATPIVDSETFEFSIEPNSVHVSCDQGTTTVALRSGIARY